MRFDLVDAVLEISADRIVTIKQVSMAEEYLQDHFPGFPILPGVFMLEAMVQSARRLARERDPAAGRLVLGGVRALKYGAMVRPGDTMRVEIERIGAEADGSQTFKGSVRVARAGESARDASAGAAQAASGKFTLRPIRALSQTPHLSETGRASR